MQIISNLYCLSLKLEFHTHFYLRGADICPDLKYRMTEIPPARIGTRGVKHCHLPDYTIVTHG